VGSLDHHDIRVVGPHGFSRFARLIGTNSSSDGTPRTATYGLVPDGGYWDPSENGTYTIEVKGGQVADTDGNYVADGILGTFTVAAPEFVLCDTNGNGRVSALDALLVINDLLRNGAHPVPIPPGGKQTPFPYLDVNGDGLVSPLDALTVINRLLTSSSGGGTATRARLQAQPVAQQSAPNPLVSAPFVAVGTTLMPAISTQTPATQPAVLAVAELTAPPSQLPGTIKRPALTTIQLPLSSVKRRLEPAAVDAGFANLSDEQEDGLFSKPLAMSENRLSSAAVFRI
jgi:hypothetical protein